MVSSVQNLNLFSQAAAVQSVNPAKIGYSQTSFGESSSENHFASNTVGVNTNVGVGDVSYVSGQLGKSSGTARTLAFA